MTIHQQQTEGQYLIVEENDPVSLVYKVNHLIKEGWQPQGGVSVCVEQDISRGELITESVCYQAMILNTPRNYCVSTFSIPCVESSPAVPGSSPFDAA